MAKKSFSEDLHKQLDERTTARGLLAYSEEYYASYELIQQNHPKLTDFFAVKYFLLCHSLELTMKAWLKHEGATYKQLKMLGHDLEGTMRVLCDQHQLTFSAESQAMIRMVNQHYNQKDFEYSLKGSKTVPEITELAQTVHLFISKARFDILFDGDPAKLRGKQ